MGTMLRITSNFSESLQTIREWSEIIEVLRKRKCYHCKQQQKGLQNPNPGVLYLTVNALRNTFIGTEKHSKNKVKKRNKESSIFWVKFLIFVSPLLEV